MQVRERASMGFEPAGVLQEGWGDWNYMADGCVKCGQFSSSCFLNFSVSC